MGHQCRLKPYQNFHESQKFGPRKFFKLAQCLPPRCLASPDTWPPNRQSGGREGPKCECCKFHQRVSPRLSASPPPSPAALLSQHHSHFLASPVGYLYERGDRKIKTGKIQKKKKKKKKS